jgi:hypothetical protein
MKAYGSGYIDPHTTYLNNSWTYAPHVRSDICTQKTDFCKAQGKVLGTRDHGNEPSASIREKEFVDQLSDYFLRKKELVPFLY